jgi:penicillin amidase
MAKAFLLRFYWLLLAAVVVQQPLLAQEKYTLPVKGLQATVEVLRDQWGVNHIYAANQHDLFFAQGYCAAKDRLFQFELWRRQATGTLAELLGERELQRDIGMRLFTYRGDMDKELSHYHAQGKAIITAFTDGINAYIKEVNRHPEQLPVEFRLLDIQPKEWTPAVVVSRHGGILGNVVEELNYGIAVAAIGEKKLKDLLWLHPGDPNMTMDSTIRGDLFKQEILALYNAFKKDIVFTAGDITGIARNDKWLPGDALQANNSEAAAIQGVETEGSNNWTISGSRTVSGFPMLASDPHRKIALPSLRYIVHLSAPGWNVTGGGEPAIPGVAIGHNEDGAWGITVHQTDAEDLYVYDLHPQHLNQYRYKGRWVTMKEITETIAVKGKAAQTVVLRYTQHGPVAYIDSVHHKAYAVKAAWLEPGSAPYLASLRMDQAKDWNMFREACSYARLPALNMVWADKKGHTGWQVVGLIPVRKQFSGLVPVPGDGRYEWSGYLPIKERPHIDNPAKGYWATANEDNVPAGFKHPDAMGFTWPDAYRARRIEEVLKATAAIDMKKMQALQTDYGSIPARELIPLLKNITSGTALGEQARQALLSWDFVMERNSMAAGIYNKWERVFMLQANQQLVPAAISGLVSIPTTRLAEWLYHPDQRFGANPVEGRNAFLQQTFEAAIAQLKHQLGDQLSSWQYGQPNYKHITFFHPLSDLVNDTLKQRLNTIPLPRAGNGHTVGATGNMDNQGNGASFRYLTHTGNWDETLMINAPGQSDNPDSRWYKNLVALWARDEYFPAYFTKGKIKQVTAEQTLLQPAQ